MSSSFFLWTDPGGREAPLGGKARALWLLGQAGFAVPPWLAVLPVTGRAFDLPPETAIALLHTLQQVDAAVTLWAVRSSAADEDQAEYSFAGQLESFLNVPAADVPARVADVRRSGFSDRILAYRKEHGLTGDIPCPTVMVQAMVPADCAGVAFSADAVAGQWDTAVVAAVRGLGEALVSGRRNADTFKVDLEGRVGERRLSEPGGPVLSDREIADVAVLSRRAEAFFGRPQDIEWALAQGRLFLLQSRPITALDRVADSRATRRIWDNSNIAESYAGVTTPLTYSFARYIYEEVYWQFCRLLGVPEKKLEEHADIFGRMLGLVRGRIYYSMLDWYQALALLPGFTFNRQFMEQMMGVKEGLPEDLARRFEQASVRARLADLLHLFSTIIGLLAARRNLPKIKAAFQARLHAALQEPPVGFDRQRADELAAHYRDLERQLLTRWDAPMINDFMAMVYFGVLRSLCGKWLGAESLANDLVGGCGGMVSTEPARRVEELAALVRRQPGLAQVLCQGRPEAALAALQGDPERAELLRQYLDKFGDRCMEELKLESPTLREGPELLVRAIGRLAWHTKGQPRAPYNAREQAEQRVRAALAAHPVRSWIFHRVLARARGYVRDRENLRLDRTRLFARVRRVFTEIGRRLWALNRLEAPGDIFYLTVQEVLGYVEGTASCADLKGMVAVRQREFEQYRATPPPADRFETLGVVYVGNACQAAIQAPAAQGDYRTGTPCCPGVVRGRARVVITPQGAEMLPGEILVASRTDPGWVILFPAAAGLVVEHGSLLSHSAIVARELGLPAVVALAGATAWLQTGDWIELDGAAGTVRRLLPGELAHA